MLSPNFSAPSSWCPVVMVPVERFYVSQMAIATGHSMDYRRYMWKVSY